MPEFLLPLVEHAGLLLRLALAALLGGLIGLEREWSGKPAGFRTHLLIALGAALFTEVSISLPEIVRPGTGTEAVSDPTRIAAQIVTGIGFLGAGTIIQMRGSVVGLTTAATMWVVAGIGMAVGGRAYFAAGAATTVVLVALVLLMPVERALERRAPVGALLHVRFQGDLDRVGMLRDTAADLGVQVDQLDMERSGEGAYALHMRGSARPEAWQGVVPALLRHDWVTRVDVG